MKLEPHQSTPLKVMNLSELQAFQMQLRLSSLSLVFATGALRAIKMLRDVMA